MNGQTSCATRSRTGIAATMESAHAAPDFEAVRAGAEAATTGPPLAQPTANRQATASNDHEADSFRTM